MAGGPSTPALSQEAEYYGVTLGSPRYDDDDWGAKLDVVCDLQPEAVSFTFGSPTKSQCRRITGAGILDTCHGDHGG